MNVVIIDYGMGNIKSLISAFRYLGVNDVSVSYDINKLQKSDRLVLPGVGSFSKAIRNIKERNLDAILTNLINHEKKPILGICLGMQLMGLSSTEQGYNGGLGFIEGDVTRFDETDLKIPHIGFNQVEINSHSKLYHGIEGLMDFYFIHSYKMQSAADINQSYCNYGERFVASFEKDNIVGVQYHPELSQKNGLAIMKNFIEKF